jgi:hypothetical protein
MPLLKVAFFLLNFQAIAQKTLLYLGAISAI